ncbi:AAA family ATPase [Simkania sp.]|uniref:AAA family ATPase n=1 Tax=Simkania sp. TaxID=34094 RepID=UPI003B52DBA3
MRVAVSGTHHSGKSTLVEALEKQFEWYTALDEPYFLLEQEGYIFSDPPALEDFEEQFKRSIQLIEESDQNTIFDRCPLDFLAYAMVISKRVDETLWMEEMKDAINLLDLIVFLPIEPRDRIPVPHEENLKFRQRVNEKMEEVFLSDDLGILNKVKVLKVEGDLAKRVKEVNLHMLV